MAMAQLVRRIPDHIGFTDVCATRYVWCSGHCILDHLCWRFPFSTRHCCPGGNDQKYVGEIGKFWLWISSSDHPICGARPTHRPSAIILDNTPTVAGCTKCQTNQFCRKKADSFGNMQCCSGVPSWHWCYSRTVHGLTTVWRTMRQILSILVCAMFLTNNFFLFTFNSTYPLQTGTWCSVIIPTDPVSAVINTLRDKWFEMWEWTIHKDPHL